MWGRTDRATLHVFPDISSHRRLRQNRTRFSLPSLPTGVAPPSVCRRMPVSERSFRAEVTRTASLSDDDPHVVRCAKLRGVQPRHHDLTIGITGQLALD